MDSCTCSNCSTCISWFWITDVIGSRQCALLMADKLNDPSKQKLSRSIKKVIRSWMYFERNVLSFICLPSFYVRQQHFSCYRTILFSQRKRERDTKFQLYYWSNQWVGRQTGCNHVNSINTDWDAYGLLTSMFAVCNSFLKKTPY